MKISVVIPVFGDAASLREMVMRLCEISINNHYFLEVIIVDDGSHAAVWDDIKSLRDVFSYGRLVLVRLRENYGQAQATLQGMLYAKGEYLVTIDADLQHLPEFIPFLISELVSGGFDIVYARGRSGAGFLRRILSHVNRILSSPLGSSLRHASSFRAIDRVFFDKCVLGIPIFVINIDEFFYRFSPKWSCLDSPHEKRWSGRSSYSIARVFWYFFGSIFTARDFSRGVFVFSSLLIAVLLFSLSSGSEVFRVSLFVCGVFCLFSLFGRVFFNGFCSSRKVVVSDLYDFSPSLQESFDQVESLK